MADWYLPSAHASQVVWPAAAAAVPSRQGVHWMEAGVPDALPAGHTLQLAAPPLLNSPAAHAPHEEDPLSGAALPALQSLHAALPSAEKVPGRHRLHCAAPVCAALPGAHGTQADAPLTFA